MASYHTHSTHFVKFAKKICDQIAKHQNTNNQPQICKQMRDASKKKSNATKSNSTVEKYKMNKKKSDKPSLINSI